MEKASAVAVEIGDDTAVEGVCGYGGLEVDMGAYGCFGASDKIQYFGAAFIFAGLIGLFERIWPEEEGM